MPLSVLLLLLPAYFLFNFRDNIKSQNSTSPPVPFIQQELIPLKMTGWFAYWDEKNSQNSLNYVFPRLEIFSPMLYQVSADGLLEVLPIVNRNQVMEGAREYNLPIIPVIGDGGERNNLLKLLGDEKKSRQFTDSLIHEAEANQFKGWSLDFEALDSTDGQIFTGFVKYLNEKLKTHNLVLHLILYGRVEKETYDKALAHNYKELSPYADRLYLMVYNYNNEFTDPGGQTPLTWYENVLKYAVKSVPKEKIAVGLSTHGYRWDQNGSVTGLTYPQISEIISDDDPVIYFDETQSAKTFMLNGNSGTSSEIWYEDNETLIQKIKLAREKYGLDKFALWRIGAEDPQIWPDMDKLINPV